MARIPPNTPVKGDRCKRRGKFTELGTVIKIDPTKTNNWCTVKWDHSVNTMICHLFELETV